MPDRYPPHRNAAGFVKVDKADIVGQRTGGGRRAGVGLPTIKIPVTFLMSVSRCVHNSWSVRSPAFRTEFNAVADRQIVRIVDLQLLLVA